MKYEVNYCRDFGGKVGDQWLWRTIEAKNEEEAMKIIYEEYKAKYIVSIAPIN